MTVTMRIFCLYCIFAITSLYGLQMAYGAETVIGSSLPDWSERSDEELFVMTVVQDRHVLSPGVVVYYDGTDLLLPLGEMAKVLEFSISVDPSTGTAQGWYFNSDHQFALDMRNNLVTVAGVEHKYDPAKVERHGSDIYIAASEWEQWFGILLTAEFQQQEIEIETSQPLPYEIRAEQEKRRSGISRYTDDGEEITYTEPPNDFFEWPFVDVSIFGSNSKSGSNEYSQVNQTATIAGVIGELDAEATMYRQKDNSRPDIRARVGRKSVAGDLLGPLNAHEYALGDIATPSIPLISDNVAGRGVLVSSYGLNELNQTNQITLRGNLAAGWEVELFRNEELLGFQTGQSVGGGRYEFQDVPTLFGLNVFRLVFYGPQGQMREQTEEYFVTTALSKPGETAFRLAVNQAETDLFSFEETGYNESVDAGKERVVFQMEHGLTDIVSVRGSFVSLHLDGERHDYVSTGVRTSLLGSLVNLDLGLDQSGGFAVGGTVQTSINSWSVTAEQNWFEDFVSEKSEDLSINGEAVFSETVLRLFGSVPGFGSSKRLPVSTRVSYQIGENGAWLTDLDGRISYYAYPLNFALESNNWIRSDGVSYSDLSLIGSTSGEVRLRGIVNFTPSEDRFFNYSSLYADWSFAQNSGLTGGVQYSNNETNTVLFSTGLYHNFEHFNLGTSFNMDTERNYGMSLSLSFSLGHDPMNDRIEMRGDQFARNSAIGAKVFLDKNNDGQFNLGDEPIENVGFSGGAVPDTVKTSKDGSAFIPGIAPYRRVNIEVNEKTLEDPSWLPADPPKHLYLRPGLTTDLYFPVVETGDVDGWVLIKGTEAKPASGIQLLIVNEKGDTVAQVESAFDGYYYAGDVPYGNYSIIVDPEQLEKLGYEMVGTQSIELNSDEPSLLDRNVEITAAQQ
ncbi:carboxypeptidase-like regulatory domain-containing protein [Sneathiella marina]|uniref:Carboxypeptidase-like regulatory domain-containing protein n=1 Tax=Sneathiella marina TaxID=2950108 RepID=A0ABY4VYR9_9PROT|nr:carboxypeptidase-like regulatory domain-containing protein [Sneathiella marina]USG59744.1 carboxypeptidase-like regulatory domain-containing protein [Sneathiella marina]